MSDNHEHVQSLLKSLDPERFLACLYLPESIRQLGLTTYAFDAEIARIPDIVSEPMPGEIRLQWWRDLIKSDGNAGSGPLAEELLCMIAQHNLPRDVLDNALEARIFDLYQDPMPDMVSYEGYLGETVSSFLHMLAVAHGVERNIDLADACGHAGVAVGMTRHLSSCAYTRARGQVYFPLTILQSHGLDRESWLLGEVNKSHEAVLLEMMEAAKSHMTKAREAISKTPKDCRSIFLPFVFAEKNLSKIEPNPTQCFKGNVTLGPLHRQWIAFRGIGKL